MKQLQKLKTISLLKLTVVTAKQSNQVNLKSLKLRPDGHKRSARNRDCDNNEIANCNQKKVADGESRLNSRMIKETINSLKNPNYIYKIPYKFPEIWLPNLWQF